MRTPRRRTARLAALLALAAVLAGCLGDDAGANDPALNDPTVLDPENPQDEG